MSNDKDRKSVTCLNTSRYTPILCFKHKLYSHFPVHLFVASCKTQQTRVQNSSENVSWHNTKGFIHLQVSSRVGVKWKDDPACTHDEWEEEWEKG